MTRQALEEARVPPSALVALHLLAFVAGPFALFQWMELLVALEGGPVSCAIDETFDCSKVWALPAAKAIQRLSGLPLAAWGLVWAFVAFVAVLRLSMDRVGRDDPRAGILGVRVVAGGGVLASVGLFALSVSAGVLCPSCLVTYVLVFAYAAVAFFGLRAPPGRPAIPSSLGPVVAAGFIGWLALLWPGLSTPVESRLLEGPVPGAKRAARGEGDRSGAPQGDPLTALVSGLPPRGREVLAEAVERLRSEPKNAGFEPRRLRGSPDAPVIITDFSDLRCPHCRVMAEALHGLEGDLGDRFAEDARYFPLSAACNPQIPSEMVDPTGARCYGAKVLLCFEDRPEYFELRRRLFEAQEALTKQEVVRIAEEVLGVDEATVDACASASAVEEKLEEDIAYAMRYDIQGTPLVLVNGREVPGHPTIVYALILAGGDPDHPAFRDLPRPSGRR